MNRRIFVISMLLLALLALATSVLADSDAVTYRIEKWTVDGGGGVSSGGVYAVTGTNGQPDAGTLTGGVYGLNGSGFWGQTVYNAYLPTILRDF